MGLTVIWIYKAALLSNDSTPYPGAISITWLHGGTELNGELYACWVYKEHAYIP